MEVLFIYSFYDFTPRLVNYKTEIFNFFKYEFVAASTRKTRKSFFGLSPRARRWSLNAFHKERIH